MIRILAQEALRTASFRSRLHIKHLSGPRPAKTMSFSNSPFKLAPADSSRLFNSSSYAPLSSHIASLDNDQNDTLPDSICLTGLSVRMLVGVDNWERVKPQPVSIDVRIHTDVSQAGKADHLPHSIHYGVLTKELENHCTVERYRSLEALAEGLAKVCLFVCRAPRVTLRVEKPRALLHAHSAGVQIIRTASDFVASDGRTGDELYAPLKRSASTPSVEQLTDLRLSSTSVWAQSDRVFVKDLCISTILGVNPWERVDKQIVRINLEVFSGLERLRQAALLNASSKLSTTALPVDLVTRPQNYRTIVRSISRHVEQSNYKTVESLATSIAAVAIGENRVERIRVRVDKPSAIMFADCAGVEVERDRAFFEREGLPSTSTNDDPQLDARALSPSTMQDSMAASFSAKASEAASDALLNNGADSEWHVAAIALGSNVGDRFSNIELAVQMLSESNDCHLVDTSFLYETEPKYFTDQPRFINGACRIATRLEPFALLRLCQDIERAVGRDKRNVPVKGPRAIDLDILLYDRVELASPELTIPHAGLTEREFALMPLIDILPDYRHPGTSRTISQLHSILINSDGYEYEPMQRILPLRHPKPNVGWKWGSKTFVMGIINATPDSFSDGGDNATVEQAVQVAKTMTEEGADVLDIGGMSTAPNAQEITAEEEAARVVPVIRAIREAGIDTAISIDTFRASVAEASLEAGADIINDVSAGVRDPEILDVARRHACPIVLMHMRGDSETMNSMSKYAGGDVVGVVRRELEERIEVALRHGVRRWNIVLDPGIGFAKNAEGNLKLLRGLAHLRSGDLSSANEKGMSILNNSSRSSTPSSPHLPSHAWNGDAQDDQSHAAAAPSSTSLMPNSTLRAFPLLVGPSRKRFIGTITGRVNAKDRVAGTAAACTASILAGANVIRVHDVKEMVDVAKTADAIAHA